MGNFVEICESDRGSVIYLYVSFYLILGDEPVEWCYADFLLTGDDELGLF